MPADLGEYVQRDAALLAKLGWKVFCSSRRRRSDFNNLVHMKHPARQLLQHVKTNGVPVILKSAPWSQQQCDDAVRRGPHKSCLEFVDFLEEEFVDMIGKDQWVVLPYKSVKHLENLHISPPGVVPQRDRRPRWICDYSFSGVNEDTADVAPAEAMQFGHALERILREILLADPAQGPVHMIKVDISDGFYRINLRPADVPKLGVVFPTKPGAEPLVAFPLVLPMGWTHSPPFFSAATETAADIANTHLQSGQPSAPHHLDELASTLSAGASPSLPSPASDQPPTIQQYCQSLPHHRDPSLPSRLDFLHYIDVFVDDFIGLAQGGRKNRGHVRRVLLHAIDSIFRPLDKDDDPLRREPVSMKKLLQGDCTWSTIRNVLGWIVDSVAMTISLPQHRQERLAEILASIPTTQRRISTKKWHKVLGELRSMSIALPGARHLFSHMQSALQTEKGGRIALRHGVHQALEDFRWIAKDISSRPTRIQEIIPLNPSVMGDHDASGAGAGGVWFPTPTLDSRVSTSAPPILWRFEWPKEVQEQLITEANPHGTITNSELELAGGLLHLEAAAQCFDVRERTLLSRTDNLAALFWQRKGSATTIKAPSFLLRQFGIHQRYHRYVPRHDYISGPSNPLADDASRLFHMSDSEFLHYFNTTYPQSKSFHYWTPSKQLTSAVISALLRKACKPESLLVVPPPSKPSGKSGSPSPLTWASTPFSKPSRTKYTSYKSSPNEFDLANFQPAAVTSSLDRLKITYGQLDRRTNCWVSKTLARLPQVMQ